MVASMPSHFNRILVPEPHPAVIGLEKYDFTRIAESGAHSSTRYSFKASSSASTKAVGSPAARWTVPELLLAVLRVSEVV